MSDDDAPDAHRYELFTTDGAVRFALTLKDHGIALEPRALALMRAGRWTRADFADIASVTLSTATAGRTILAQCTIGLVNGGRIVVSNAGASGIADGRHDQAFRLFVRDLHAALVESGAAAGIAFRSGYSAGRSMGLNIAVGAAVLLLGVLPLILFFISGEVKILGALVVGAFLLWPMLRVARMNTPRTYSPGNPPDLIP